MEVIIGKTMLGGVSHEGNVGLLTPEQESYLGQAMSGLGQMGQQMDPSQFQEMFQQSYVNPAKQMLERQIVPSLKEAYLGEETGSSALNQALSQSATDLSTALGSQLMNQYNLGQNRQMQALGQLGQIGTSRTYEPLIEQNQGLLGPLIGALGGIGGQGLLGWLLSRTGQGQNMPSRPIE